MACVSMELKSQDVLVLLKVVANPPQRWTYAALGEALAMSASEAHACVKRAVACGLAVSQGRAGWQPVRPALLEFVLHGVRYVWPAIPGPVKRGVPTSIGTEPLVSELGVAPGEAPVWAHPDGCAKGPTLSPLYRTAAAGGAGRSRVTPLTGSAGRSAQRSSAGGRTADCCYRSEPMTPICLGGAGAH